MSARDFILSEAEASDYSTPETTKSKSSSKRKTAKATTSKGKAKKPVAKTTKHRAAPESSDESDEEIVEKKRAKKDEVSANTSEVLIDLSDKRFAADPNTPYFKCYLGYKWWVCTSLYEGRLYFSLRTFVDDNATTATKIGANLPIEMLDKTVKAFNKMKQHYASTNPEMFEN